MAKGCIEQMIGSVGEARIQRRLNKKNESHQTGYFGLGDRRPIQYWVVVVVTAVLFVIVSLYPRHSALYHWRIVIGPMHGFPCVRLDFCCWFQCWADHIGGWSLALTTIWVMIIIRSSLSAMVMAHVPEYIHVLWQCAVDQPWWPIHTFRVLPLPIRRWLPSEYLFHLDPLTMYNQIFARIDLENPFVNRSVVRDWSGVVVLYPGWLTDRRPQEVHCAGMCDALHCSRPDNGYLPAFFIPGWCDMKA